MNTCILARDTDGDYGILKRVESSVEVLDQAIIEGNEIGSLIKDFVFSVS